MSHVFTASLNRLEKLIESNQEEVSSLRDDVKCCHSSLEQISNLLVGLVKRVEDNRHDLNDLPNRIRDILSTVTTSKQKQTSTGTHDFDDVNASSIGDKVTVESVNNCGINGDEFGTETQATSLETNVPSTVTANSNDELMMSELSYYSTLDEIVRGQMMSETSLQQSNETTLNASEMWWDSYMDVYAHDEDEYHCDDVFDDNESVHEQSNPDTNQNFENDNQIDQLMQSDFATNENEQYNNRNKSLQEEEEENEPNQSGNSAEQFGQQLVGKDGLEPNELSISTSGPNHQTQSSPCTSNQSKTRQSKRPHKSLTVESDKVPTTGPNTRSKQMRVIPPLQTEIQQVNIHNSSEIEEQNEVLSSADEMQQSEESDEMSDDETELNEGGGNYHIEIINLKCTEQDCLLVFTSRNDLYAHLRNDHRTLPYKCFAQSCAERFDGRNSLLMHIRLNHSKTSIWSCPHCTQTCKTQNRMYHHQHLYHFEGQFKCGYDDCDDDRVATIRYDIIKHQYSAHPKTIYYCKFANCNKTFKQKSNFDHHKRTHTGAKPFRCGWVGCGKSFSRKDVLNIHRRSHTGEKPYRCETVGCGKTFSQKANLTDHQRIHQGVKPFKCTWNACDFASAKYSSAIKHIRTQHFNLPSSKAKQNRLNIKDNRNPRDYLTNTQQ